MMTQEQYRELNRKYQAEKIQRAEDVRRYAEKLAPMVPWLNKGEYYYVTWENDDGRGDEYYTNSRYSAVCRFLEYMSWGHDYSGLKIDSPDRGTITIFNNSDVPVLMPLPA